MKDYAERIAATTDFLETVGEDYDRLATLPQADRQRFLLAAGRVAGPGSTRPSQGRPRTASAPAGVFIPAGASPLLKPC